MAVGPRLDLRQSQSLTMTPQLQQAIRLLALSNVEIAAHLAAEIEQNPLLSGSDTEEPLDADGHDPGDPLSMQAPEEPGRQDEDLHSADHLPAGTPNAGEEPLDSGAADGDARFDEAGPPSSATEAIDFDGFSAAGPSLTNHLLAQAGATLSGKALSIAQVLIAEIDPAGYFTGNMLDIAHRLGVALAEVERALSHIQGFDPTGVGARTLAECLALQAKDADRYDPCMAVLIGHLDWLAHGRIPALQKLCGVDDEDMADMIRELRGYDPKPGLRFATDAADPIIPDLIVRQDGGGWRVDLNPASLPRVAVNQAYYQSLRADTRDRTTRTWVEGCFASANSLLRMLDQRQRTILTVARAIIAHQQAFFSEGAARLRPLTHRALAEEVKLHESTVSRVTTAKYLSCPRGVFELKFFFSSAVGANESGDQASAQAIKEAIRILIAGETAADVLSDDTLVVQLKARGFEVARRTVAKYREAMGLGSSVQRRRAKAITARMEG